MGPRIGGDKRPGVPETRSLEEQCRAIEAMLLDVQRVARIGIWEWDPRDGRVTWSPFMWSLRGSEPEARQLAADEVLAGIHPDDRDRVRRLFDPAWDGKPREFDYRVIRADGTEAVLHARTRVERDAGGRVERVVGTSQEVTEERRMEGLRQKEFMAAIVESASDAIYAKDLDGMITSWNPAAVAIFGYTADEVVGKPVTLILPPELLPEEAGVMARIRRGESVANFETQRLAKGGRRIDVSVSLSPVRDRDGRVVGAASVVRDITERKRHLERERAAMDAEIRRLDEMARFRARFLNIAAHELKTPLTPIRLQLQLLEILLKEAPPKVQHSLVVLTRSVERLRNLMDDVLDAARVQATQLKLRRERLDVGRTLYEALETYAPLARKMGLRLKVDLPGPAEVEGDPVRLLQVINNVLSNAIKFTPEGGELEVRLARGQDEAVLTVTDTGRGLTQEQVQQLFQPFMQVHPELEATSKGTGLGLYIVKAIVEQHGGRIAIQSPGPDKGTTVTVTLPLAPQEAPLPERQDPAPAPPSPGHGRPGRHARRQAQRERTRQIL